MSKVQRFVDEIIEDRKLHPICQTCGHGKDQHAFDIYPMKNPNKPCELSCMICFDEETERLKKTQTQTSLSWGRLQLGDENYCQVCGKKLKNLKDLEYYSYDVDGDDPTDAIFYSRLQDQINEKIREIEN